MPLCAETQELQQAFARYCRDPQVPVPGIAQDRLEVYRSLVFGAVADALRRAFPLTVQILGEERWTYLIENFFAEHPSTSPQLWQMPAALVDYVADSSWLEEYPFLFDLLRFEWIEIEVHMMEDGVTPEIFPLSGNILNARLCLNPDHRLLEVSYPVHREFEGDKLVLMNEPRSLLIFRERKSWQVRFIELSQATRLFLQALLEADISPARLIDVMETTTGQRVDRVAVANLLELFSKEGFILGEQREVVDE